jgi:hypothetical protein
MNVMKNDMLQSHARVDRSIIESVQEVKETIASNVNLKRVSNRSFGLPDLWNIRRRSRYAADLVRR